MNSFQANPPKKKLMSVMAVYIAVATSIMLSSGGSTMLPVAAAEIGGANIYTMALTLPSVIGIPLMPLFGYISARNPAIRRPLFVTGFLLAAVSIFLRGIAQNMWVIVITSLLLCMYSPSIYVLGYSMIREMYDQKQAGIYLGAVGTMQSIGLLLGPLLTGFLIEEISWRAVNFVIFPLFLLAAALMFLGARITKEEGKAMATTTSKFDSAGGMAVMVFLTALILFLSLGEYAPFGSTLNIIFLVTAIVALIYLITIIRKKGNDAFIPAPVLKDTNTLCLMSAVFFTTCSAMAITIFMPVYILYIMKQVASVTGIAMAIYAVAGLFMGPIYGQIIGKAGNARSVVMWGSGALRCIVVIACIFLLSADTPIWLVYALMLISGFYSSAGGVAFAVAPQIQLRPEIRQQGNSIIQLGQNFGGSTSIAVYTAVMAMMGGPEKGFTVVLIISAVSAAIVFFLGIPLKKLETSAAQK